MSVVVVVTAFPVPEHRAEVVAAFEAAIARVHDEPGVELYALHEGQGRLVMIEKYGSDRRARNTPRVRPWPTCGRLCRASSAAVSTRRSSCRTRPETRRRARCDRTPVTHQRNRPRHARRDTDHEHRHCCHKRGSSRSAVPCRCCRRGDRRPSATDRGVAAARAGAGR